MKKSYIFPSFLIISATAPLVAFAASLEDIILEVQSLVETIIPLISLVAIAVFLYGIVKYIFSAGDAEKEKAARRHIYAGLIGLFVLVAFWALITVITETFGLDQAAPPIRPETSIF